MQTSKASSQLKEVQQELSSKGFGLYGLARDKSGDFEKLSEKHDLTLQWLLDENGGLISGLGLEKNPGKGLVKGVVVIGKDGRVIVSEAENTNATVESVAAFIETLDSLERTPTLEYNGEGYFPRSPFSPSTSETQSDYFHTGSPVSPSTASLHSYLQFLNSTTSRAPLRHSVSAAPQASTNAHHTSVTLRRPRPPMRNSTWHAPGTEIASNGIRCPKCGKTSVGETLCDSGNHSLEVDDSADGPNAPNNFL
ncbi:MAG: hypothetical protein Q9159_005350 [Coniocarpon cinnabarinum]